MSDIEEFEEVEEIMFLFPYRSERIIRERMDNFNLYSDYEFINRFRLSKECVIELLNRIHHLITPETQRNNAVSAMNKLLLTMRFYATGNMLLSVADFAGVSLTSSSEFVKLVTNAICTIRNEFIKMPTGAEIKDIQRQFYEIASFPLAVGAIDCTHVRIQSPGGDAAENFRNRKGYFSVNVQTISGPDLKILDIVARWPGASHDQTIFDNSVVRGRIESGEFNNGVLLGDSGYMCRSYLLTPLLNPQTQAENLYNESQIRTRNVVERQYGVWKRRFPILRLEMRIELNRALAVIIATAILNNIAINMNEEQPPIDPDIIIMEDEEIPQQINGLPGNDFRRRFLIDDYFSRLNND